MNLAEKAYMELFPNRPLDHEFSVKYTAKFKPYRANVRMRDNRVLFSMSRKWKSVSHEIQIGIIQDLMQRILSRKMKIDRVKTTSMDLYNIFLKKIHMAIPKTNIDPLLEESFDRVNEKYFNNMIEKPNLVWGAYSTSKLGSYEYGSDTITMSRIFENSDTKLLDYVMHHEMLHKKHKFNHGSCRTLHHTAEFRKEESMFEGRELMERGIRKLAGSSRRKVSIFSLFGL